MKFTLLRVLRTEVKALTFFLEMPSLNCLLLIYLNFSSLSELFTITASDFGFSSAFVSIATFFAASMIDFCNLTALKKHLFSKNINFEIQNVKKNC